MPSNNTYYPLLHNYSRVDKQNEGKMNLERGFSYSSVLFGVNGASTAPLMLAVIFKPLVGQFWDETNGEDTGKAPLS